ncbi:hypothetical protein THIOKS11130015 [Thiocapsa sp. KS1]|nr:hypothetical protein THIOKS11130015 [Thiocapsa sp. KS1]
MKANVHIARSTEIFSQQPLDKCGNFT